MRSNDGVAWARTGGVLLVVHAPREPTDQEWAEMMSSSDHERLSGAVIIVNDGVRPTPKQRAEIQQRMRRDVPLAIVTDSLLTRGAVTALGWLGVKVRAFSGSERGAALSWAGVFDVERGLQLLDEMGRRVSGRQANTG